MSRSNGEHVVHNLIVVMLYILINQSLSKVKIDKLKQIEQNYCILVELPRLKFYKKLVDQ